MQDKSAPAVMVLGMHRSGTSMISGALSRLGVDMGRDLPGSQLSNPLGHYEDGQFLELNVSILQDAGGSWDRPPAQRSILDQAGKYGSRIQEVILGRQRAARGSAWGWKDPRTCLTADLYLPFLKSPALIWCLRPPEEIAASLWQRNKMPLEEGMELNAIYQERIQDFVSRNPHLPLLRLDYGQVILDPGLWVGRMIDFLGIEPTPEQIKDAEDFIKPRAGVRQAKMIYLLKYGISLPYRVWKKILAAAGRLTTRDH